MLNPNLLPNSIILLIVLSSIYFLLFNRDLTSFCYGINNNYEEKNYKMGLEFKNNLKKECMNTFKFEEFNSINDFYRYQEFKKIITKYMFDPNINIDLLYENINKNDEIYVTIVKLRVLEIAIMIIYISSLYIVFIVLPIFLIQFIFNIITKILYLILIISVIAILLNNSNYSSNDIYKIYSYIISYFNIQELKNYFNKLIKWINKYNN